MDPQPMFRRGCGRRCSARAKSCGKSLPSQNGLGKGHPFPGTPMWEGMWVGVWQGVSQKVWEGKILRQILRKILAEESCWNILVENLALPQLGLGKSPVGADVGTHMWQGVSEKVLEGIPLPEPILSARSFGKWVALPQGCGTPPPTPLWEGMWVGV